MENTFKSIKEISSKTFEYWSSPYVVGWAPGTVVKKISAARLDWLKELTDCLGIWIKKSPGLTEGELLLAWANLGALVEGWLKLFYCIYYEDYKNNPRTIKGKAVEPNDMSFEGLKQFSRGKLWDKDSKWDIWVDSIQLKRNAIHAFNNRDIGNPPLFLRNISDFKNFIIHINTLIPYPDEVYFPYY